MEPHEYEAARAFMHSRGLLDRTIPHPSTLDRGGIVAAAEIVDCVDSSASPWFMGKIGLVLANVRALPFMPCKGTVAPMFWVPPAHVLETARRCLGLPA